MDWKGLWGILIFQRLSMSFFSCLMQARKWIREVVQVLDFFKRVISQYHAPIFIFLRFNAPIGTCCVNQILADCFFDLHRKGIVLNCFLIRYFNLLIGYRIIIVVRERNLVILWLLFSLIFYYLCKQAQVFKEVIFVLVLRVDFKNAYDSVISLVDKIVQLGTILKSNHTVHDVFFKNFVRITADLLKSLRSLVNFFVDIFIIWLVFIKVIHFVIFVV